MRRSRRVGARGFSLIELCIVIAIFGVIAALALPAVRDIVQQRASANEVAKVHALLESARDDARASLRCIHIAKVTASSLTIEELAPDLSDADGCGTTVTSTKTKVFDARLVELTSDVDVTFTRAGGAAGNVDPVLTVSALRVDGARRPYTIHIHRLLGLVRRT